MIWQRIDAVRDHLSTLDIDHPMRRYWEHVESHLVSELRILVAETPAVSPDKGQD